jgi:WD40 repeat protein
MEVEDVADVNGFVLSPDEAYVGLLFERHVSICDLPSGVKVAEVDPGSAPLCASFSEVGPYIATGAEDCTLVVWELPSGRELMRVEHKTSRGRLVAAVYPDGEEHLQFADDLSADGRLLATKGGDVTRVWGCPRRPPVASS